MVWGIEQKLTKKAKVAETGAGRGIGRAIALRLAREGASVTVADLDEANAQDVAKEITTAGGQAQAIKIDVTRFICMEAWNNRQPSSQLRLTWD